MDRSDMREVAAVDVIIDQNEELLSRIKVLFDIHLELKHEHVLLRMRFDDMLLKLHEVSDKIKEVSDRLDTVDY